MPSLDPPVRSRTEVHGLGGEMYVSRMRLVAAVLVVIGAGLLAIAASFLLLDSGGSSTSPLPFSC